MVKAPNSFILPSHPISHASIGLNKQLRGINSFHSHISGDYNLNSSLDPVISEEDAQLENDVPIV